MNNKINCPNCGAPVTTEICPYCHTKTGLDTANSDMEYPVIECKEATISFMTVGFPMIFAVSFGFFGFVFPILFSLGDKSSFLPVALFCSIFAIIGIAAFIIGIRPLIRYLIIKRNGKDIIATVYGYMDDNLYINGSPAQIVKLLVNTNEGQRFILYQLGDIKKPYKINSQIELMVYKNYFLIKNKKEYYF